MQVLKVLLILWSNGGTDSTISINDLGIYSVTVTNACGVRNDTIKIYPADCSCPVYAPNAIMYSALGENGQFKFTTDCGEFIEYDLTIFNRWGKQIYHSTDQEKAWRPIEEGIVNQDVYIYILQYSLKEGRVHQKSGEIIILH